ncbi:hypothetical protein D3C71_1123860 [compost metagenome]
MGEGDQPALGCGIGFTVRFGLPCTRRGDVDDGPGVLAQGGQGVFAAQEGAMQAGKAALPLSQRHLRQRRAMGTGDAGIVDQAIHAAKALHRRLHQRLHTALAGHVRALECRALRQRPFGQTGLAGIGIQVGNHHTAAGAEHRLRDAAAHPLRTAGDHHHAIAQRLCRPVENGRGQWHGGMSLRPSRRVQPSMPSLSSVSMLRSTITSGSGNAATARSTLSSRSRCRVG